MTKDELIKRIKETAYLEKHNIPLVEAPNNLEQIERMEKSKPDLIVSPLAFSYPLETRGFKIIWSVKFFLPGNSIYGLDNALVLLKMFTNPFRSA